MKFNIEEQYKNAIGVYKIINLINGKFYVGSTAISFYKRYKQHINRFKNKNEKNHCKKLFNAIKKYGVENFEFILLEICLEKKDVINTEQKYINLGTNYNICLIANSKLGCKCSEKTKNKLRSGSHIDIHKKPIIQYTLDGTKIKEFNSSVEAEKFFKKKPNNNHINKVCNNKRYSAYGYRWTFKDKKLNNKIYIKNNSIYLEFNFQTECAKYLNIPSSTFNNYVKKGFSKKHNLKIGKLI